MSISKDLMLAVLSLDVYNRGYSAGIGGMPEGGPVGTAVQINPDSIGRTASVLSAWQAAGFYAAAYDTPYGVVISYRGTDKGYDYTKGWLTGAGLDSTYTQADEALAFYSSVTGRPIADPNAPSQPPPPNVIVTGHSLGGGLAGYVSATQGVTGVGFDHSPFGFAAVSFFDNDGNIDINWKPENFQNFKELR